jgi:sulfhydrogenase subunit beta (sulfur reductase)
VSDQATASAGVASVIGRDALDQLLAALRDRNYTTIGPMVRDGTIVYAEIQRSDELPIGWTDEQAPGSYRLKRRDDDAVFGFAVGPGSAKKYLLPPALRLWKAARDGSGKISIAEQGQPTQKLALIGVRACDLSAIAIQDTVMIGGAHPDSHYARQRKDLLIVAVNCIKAGATCFCASMGTGPRAKSNYDLALTELLESGAHSFLVEIGSEAGAEVMRAVAHREATEADLAAARQVSERVASQMGRRLDTNGIKELLYANAEHPRWDDVANRCLACTNCTMVCPTCFCTTVEDRADLDGSSAERIRMWDSCYTMDFSHLPGGSVRSSIKSRYRQWMTHKLASWIDQFGSSGCVGCGRCITWCPVGIDLTEETAAMRATDVRAATPPRE